MKKTMKDEAVGSFLFPSIFNRDWEKGPERPERPETCEKQAGKR
jgi:hypothetical protein